MPTPDASQFVRMKRLQALETRVTSQTTSTSSYQPKASALRLNDFLPSFTNKFVTPQKQVAINFDTAPKAKPKKPSQ